MTSLLAQFLKGRRAILRRAIPGHDQIARKELEQKETRKMNNSIQKLAAIVVATSSSAGAATLSVTISGTGSGWLGGIAFTDEDFILTTSYETEDITSFPGGLFAVVEPPSFNLSGETFTITDPTSIAVYQDTSSFAFGNDRILRDILLSGDPIFATYDLQTPLASVSASNGRIVGGADLQTEQGELLFLNDFSANLTTAISIPETGSPLILGASALLFLRRRR